MRLVRPGSWCAPPVLICAALLAAPATPAPAQPAADRLLVNAWEVHDEIRPAAGTEAAVKDTFPSFLEYQDLVMFHPRFGYYGSGRVNFFSDYQTFPNVLAPYFGHMIAEQVFRMWQGMRAAGTLKAGETFTIAEFGAGNGSLAESILDYLARQEKSASDAQWREFASQVVYACYDRSPALSKKQRERNARFGKRFEAREADATEPGAAIKPESLKGVVVSNELPDAFSVHKVAISADGVPEVAFVAPSFPRSAWDRYRKLVPAAAAQGVEKGDKAVRERFFSGRPDRVYLTRQTFAAVLDALAPAKEYEDAAQALLFNELYVPVGVYPSLAAHFRRYGHIYAVELAKSGRGVVTYVNPGLETFIQGAARVLKAGYVITLDYGSNFEGIMAQDAHPHLRTYGPAHKEENLASADYNDGGYASDVDTSDPYRGPTLNDMTTDVNFSVLDAEGRQAGLVTAYYGAQAALRKGTPVVLDQAPEDRQANEALAAEYFTWAGNFETDVNYKLMVQQKNGTDPAYLYPEANSEALASDENALSDAQREKVAEIEARLKR